MAKLDNQSIELLLFAAVALAFVSQAIVLFGLLIVMRKTAKAITGQVEEMRAAVVPVMENTRDLLARVSPKIVATSTDLAALTKSLRVQSVDAQIAANEVIARVRAQTKRIDSILSKTLDSLEHATGYVAETVNKPMRQLGALLAFAKALVESLRNSEPAHRSRQSQSSSDNDLFV